MSQKGILLKYWVLKPNGNSPHAIASRKAIIAYSDYIEFVEPQLADELRLWVVKEIDAVEEQKKQEFSL